MHKDKFKNHIKQTPIRKSKTAFRILTRPNGIIPENAIKGLVVAANGMQFIVESLENELFICIPSGMIITPHDDKSIIATGDTVYFITDGHSNKDYNLETGSIVAVEQRKSCLSRLSPGKQPQEQVIIANPDQLVILMSADNPPYNKKLIDRYIVAAEAGLTKPLLILNKSDLAEFSTIDNDLNIYRKLGINVIIISLLERTGLDNIEQFFHNKISVISGPSGTGKSSLVNFLLGSSVQKIAEISSRTGKGTHTTSSTKMFVLPHGGRIADTPGIREFGIWGISRNELALYFHDFDIYSNMCKYYPCTHTHEPNCAVVEALEQGMIDPLRYESYLNIFDSIENF